MPELSIIPVTQEHINQGKPRCSRQNPLALALRAATGQSAYVGGKIIIYTKNTKQKQVSQVYQTSLSLEIWLDHCAADQTLVGPTHFALCPGDNLADNAHAFIFGAQPVCREHTKAEIE